MKKIPIWLLVASLILAACGPQTASTPQVASKNPCTNGIEFAPGETIVLGENSDYKAEFRTSKGVRPSGNIVIIVPEGEFLSSGGEFPSQDGEVEDYQWGDRIQLMVGFCNGKYYYTATVNEVPKDKRDPICGFGFGGPLKPWPFWNEILLFRPGRGDSAWLFVGMNPPDVIEADEEGKLVERTRMGRPLEGETETLELELARGGMLKVTLKNCNKALYYKAEWRP